MQVALRYCSSAFYAAAFLPANSVFFNCSLLSYTFLNPMAIGRMHFFAKFIFFSMTKIRQHADKQACAANTQTCLKG